MQTYASIQFVSHSSFRHIGENRDFTWGEARGWAREHNLLVYVALSPGKPDTSPTSTGDSGVASSGSVCLVCLLIAYTSSCVFWTVIMMAF